MSSTMLGAKDTVVNKKDIYTTHVFREFANLNKVTYAKSFFQVNNFSQAIQVTALCFPKVLSQSLCKNFITLLLSEEIIHPKIN